jgi:hypothetical protein
VQLNPPEFGAIFRTTGTTADMQILPERDRVDPRDLHALGIVDGGASRGGKRRASESGERRSAAVFQEGSSTQAHSRSLLEMYDTLRDRVLRAEAYQKKNLTASCTMQQPAAGERLQTILRHASHIAVSGPFA